MARKFSDREDAGAALADAVAALGLADPVVLALPRGGVPVAVPVARRLSAPLDLVMVRKIGAPGNPELAAGAVVDGKAWEAVFNEGFLRQLGLTRNDFDMAIERELKTIKSRRAAYSAGRAPVAVEGRDAVLVDDGIATGATARAALTAIARRKPASVTLAVPVAPADTLDTIRPLVDHLICLATPAVFQAVGQHYVRFGQVTDDQVIAALDAVAQQGDGT